MGSSNSGYKKSYVVCVPKPSLFINSLFRKKLLCSLLFLSNGSEPILSCNLTNSCSKSNVGAASSSGSCSLVSCTAASSSGSSSGSSSCSCSLVSCTAASSSGSCACSGSLVSCTATSCSGSCACSCSLVSCTAASCSGSSSCSCSLVSCTATSCSGTGSLVSCTATSSIPSSIIVLRGTPSTIGISWFRARIISSKSSIRIINSSLRSPTEVFSNSILLFITFFKTS